MLDISYEKISKEGNSEIEFKKNTSITCNLYMANFSNPASRAKYLLIKRQEARMNACLLNELS